MRTTLPEGRECPKSVCEYQISADLKLERISKQRDRGAYIAVGLFDFESAIEAPILRSDFSTLNEIGEFDSCFAKNEFLRVHAIALRH